MVEWHHQLNRHGFEWTPGVRDGQGGLACCGSWGRKELDMTEQLNWTESFHLHVNIFGYDVVLIFKKPKWLVIFIDCFFVSYLGNYCSLMVMKMLFSISLIVVDFYDPLWINIIQGVKQGWDLFFSNGHPGVLAPYGKQTIFSSLSYANGFTEHQLTICIWVLFPDSLFCFTDLYG